VCEAERTVQPSKSQPRLRRFDRATAISMFTGYVRTPNLQATSWCCNCLWPKRTKKLLRWFSQTRHHSPPAKQSTRRPLHVTAAPSRATRHAQPIRVDSCRPWFQNAIHQRSDELDVNPRSVVFSSANDRDHPVAASDAVKCEKETTATRRASLCSLPSQD
jgi:hypothetical protein